jgi:hypothetical protein
MRFCVVKVLTNFISRVAEEQSDDAGKEVVQTLLVHTSRSKVVEHFGPFFRRHYILHHYGISIGFRIIWYHTYSKVLYSVVGEVQCISSPTYHFAKFFAILVKLSNLLVIYSTR